MYEIETEERLDKEFFKLARRDAVTYTALCKKVLEIRHNPYRFKPLRAPLQNRRRVHVGSSVLIYTVDEQRKTVRLLAFAHHDEAYR